MAEAVGLLASVATLTKLVMKSFEIAKRIIGCPAEKEALVKEIIDVQVAIAEVEKLQSLCDGQQIGDLAILDITTSLKNGVDRLDRLLEELLNFSPNFRGMIQRKKELLKKPMLERLRCELHIIRKDLVLALGLISL